MTTISNRTDFAILFDCRDGNPNGDPDMENSARMDPLTQVGWVTSNSLKRKIRDTVSMVAPSPEGYEIMISRTVPGNDSIDAAVSQIKQEGQGRIDQVSAAQAVLSRRFFDVRAFGGVLTTGLYKGEGAAGKLTGPVQIDQVARSLDRISNERKTITRVSKVESDRAGSSEMGSRYHIPYGLYWVSGCITPGFANGSRQTATGFSEQDKTVLFDAIRNMFDLDQASGRGMMTLRKLFVFEHEGELGSSRDAVLRSITVRRVDGDDKASPLPAFRPNDAALGYDDYEIVLGDLPPRVSLNAGLSVI